MFGQSPSIFGKGNKTGSASGPKNAFNFGGFGDENDSPSDLFGTPFSSESGPNDFGNKKDAGDSVFKMPEPPGSYPPPLQQQQQQLLRSPAVNASKQLPKPSPSISASPVIPSKPAEAKTAAASVNQSPYFKSSSNLSSPAPGKKDDLNKTVTFDLEESILEEEEEQLQEDNQEKFKRKQQQQDESPPQSPSYSPVDTDEEGSVKDVTQSPIKKKKTVAEGNSNNAGHRLGGVEKLRADFSEIMQQHNKIREEDEKILRFCTDSLRSKTEEMVQQMEQFVRERYDYLTEKIQQAANDFTTIAEETQMSESDVNEMKRFMAELIEKHLKFPNN